MVLVFVPEYEGLLQGRNLSRFFVLFVPWYLELHQKEGFCCSWKNGLICACVCTCEGGLGKKELCLLIIKTSVPKSKTLNLFSCKYSMMGLLVFCVIIFKTNHIDKHFIKFSTFYINRQIMYMGYIVFIE